MRQYIKPTLFATMLLIAVFAPRSGALGQSNGHFEWAKGFGTSDPTKGKCHITGSVTDSVGNLYILGQFRNDSEWGTGWTAERLLPMAPYGPWPNNNNIIIAKISPEGDMVWKKVIHSNNGTSHDPLDIKKVGDTAFACLVDILLPSEDNYTYYLDTLIPDRSDYPVSSLYFRNTLRTAFIMFDFEGNVLEQHFLFTTYTDTAGNDIVKYYPDDTIPWYSCHRFRSPSFDIDAEGNIYICRASMDWLNDSVNAQNGAIRGIKFWVDNRKVGECINESKPMFWYPQIMKFSPHFDTMLACRYIVQKNNNIEYELICTQTKIDKYGNIYFITKMEQSGSELKDTIIIDSIKNIFMGHPEKAIRQNFIVQIDSNLTPNWLITLDDSVIATGPPTYLYFHDISFDYDSNLFFLTASTGRAVVGDTIHFYSLLNYRGFQLNLKNDAFFMSFHITDTNPVLHSYGRVPALNYSHYLTSGDAAAARGNLVSVKNRIFTQVKLIGGVRLPGNVICFTNYYAASLGLIIFDYQGNIIKGLHFESYSPDSYPGSISLHDSTLYLMGRLYADATFGEIHFSTNGLQYAYIAKYVDTTFMTPYAEPTNNSITTIEDDALLLYPNPVFDRTSIGALDEPITEISALSMSGVRTAVPVKGNTLNTANLQPGIYILEIVTTGNKYHKKIIKL